MLSLLEFLSQALQETWIGHATEQAKSPRSGHATEQAKSRTKRFYAKVADYPKSLIKEECNDIAFEKITEWAGRPMNQSFYNEPALLKHKKMFDIMRYDKRGLCQREHVSPMVQKNQHTADISGQHCYRAC